MKQSLNSLLKLTNFELERISKFLYGFMGFTLVTNLIGYIYPPFRFINQVNKFTAQNTAIADQAIEQFGTYSFYNATNSLWIYGPIAIGISGLIFYAAFTWYREWFGKNTFIYRLLMLPIPRMHIFYSKLITIFISIFALISTQMLSLVIGYPIVKIIIGNNHFPDLSLMEVIEMNDIFHYVLPLNPRLFLAILGMGLVALLVLFTVILMEKSFKWKGILFGILYVIIAIVFALLPIFIPNLLRNYFILYPSEIILLEVFFLAIVGIVSLVISRHLLNNKITV